MTINIDVIVRRMHAVPTHLLWPRALQVLGEIEQAKACGISYREIARQAGYQEEAFCRAVRTAKAKRDSMQNA